MNASTPLLSDTLAQPRSARRAQLAYWIPTLLLAALMTFSGVGNMLTDAQSLELMHRLGYPDYFCCMLGVAKLLGVLALLLPVPRVLREWAYAGFSFDVIAAAVSLLAIGEGLLGVVFPLLFLLVILLSRRGWIQRSEGRA